VGACKFIFFDFLKYWLNGRLTSRLLRKRQTRTLRSWIDLLSKIMQLPVISNITLDSRSMRVSRTPGETSNPASRQTLVSMRTPDSALQTDPPLRLRLWSRDSSEMSLPSRLIKSIENFKRGLALGSHAKWVKWDRLRGVCSLWNTSEAHLDKLISLYHNLNFYSKWQSLRM
jgi:hypothetical protein